MALPDVGVHLVADGAKEFQNALGSAGDALGNLTKVVAGAAVAGVAALGAAMAGSIAAAQSWAGTIKPIGRLLGTTSEQSSALAVAVKHVGGDVDTFTRSTSILTRGLEGVSGKAGPTGKALTAMGISFQNAHGDLIPVYDLLPQIADKIASLPAGTERARAEMQLFGRSGAQLDPVLMSLANGGLTAADAKAKALGLSMGQDVVDASKKMSYAMNDIGLATQGLGVAIGSQLLPFVAPVIQQFSELAISVIPRVTGAVQSIIGTITGLVTAYNTLTKTGAGSDFFTRLQSIFGGPLANIIYDFAFKVLPQIRDTFGQIGSALASGNIGGALSALGGFISKAIAGIDWNAVRATIGAGLSSVLSSLGGLVSGAGNIAGSILTWISGQLSGVDWSGVAQTIATALGTALSTAISTATTVIGDITPQISAWIQTVNWEAVGVVIVAGIAVALGGLPLIIGAALATAFAQAGSAGTLGPLQGIYDTFNQILTFVRDNLAPILAGLGAMILTVVVPAFVTWATTASAAGSVTVLALLPIIAPIAAIGAAVALLVAAWQNNWGGIRDTLTTFWTGTAQPILSTLITWLQTNVPAAIQALSGFWTGTLLPAITSVASFITGSVIPTMQQMAGPVLDGVRLGSQLVSDLWNGVLLPALTVVEGFINTKVNPLLSALDAVYLAAVNKTSQAMAGLWQNVLQPALSAVWSFISAQVNPILQQLDAQYLQPVNKTSTDLATLWTGTVQPALQSLSDLINNTVNVTLGYLKTTYLDPLVVSFDAIGTAIDGVVGWLGTLATSISSIQLPSWLTPHSPVTDFSQALWEIHDAFRAIAGDSLPAFNTQLGFAGRSYNPPATTQSISNTVYNSSYSPSFPLTVNSQQQSQGLVSDYSLMMMRAGSY